MRHVPFLSFEVDTSIEDADQVLNMMDQLLDEQGPQTASGLSAG
jgi:ribosome-binding factor A